MDPILSAALVLWLVIDPVGNIPVWVALLREVPPRRRVWVIVRENLIALAVLVTFLFVGPTLLQVINVQETSLRIAGGVVIFLIALRMIFPTRGGVFGDEELAGEPLIVPLAVPLLAGPSAIAVIMLLTTAGPTPLTHGQALAALAIAWVPTVLILLASGAIERAIGHRGVIAVERLMGMILAIIATDMILTGVREQLIAA